MTWRLGIALLVFASASESSGGLISTVSGKASVYFAGLSSPVAPPPGGYDEDFFGDLAEPDVIPGYVNVSALVGPLSINASGLWGHSPSSSNSSGPGGRSTIERTYYQYGEFGVSRLQARFGALVGVFTSEQGPDPAATPPGLGVGDDMTRPRLNQAFAIGSSLEGVEIPPLATRLYFGLHDSFGWFNNVGEVQVEVVDVPEPPGSFLLISTLTTPLYQFRRRSRRLAAGARR